MIKPYETDLTITQTELKYTNVSHKTKLANR